MKKNIINKEIKLAARYKMSPNANLVYTDWTKKLFIQMIIGKCTNEQRMYELL